MVFSMFFKVAVHGECCLVNYRLGKLILKVVVTAGNVQDRDGAKTLLQEIGSQVKVIKRLRRI